MTKERNVKNRQSPTYIHLFTVVLFFLQGYGFLKDLKAEDERSLKKFIKTSTSRDGEDSEQVEEAKRKLKAIKRASREETKGIIAQICAVIFVCKHDKRKNTECLINLNESGSAHFFDLVRGDNSRHRSCRCFDRQRLCCRLYRPQGGANYCRLIKTSASRLFSSPPPEKKVDEKLKSMKKAELAAVKEGKKPFFLKKSERKKLTLAEKFKELKQSGKLEKYMEKKRKRNAAKLKK